LNPVCIGPGGGFFAYAPLTDPFFEYRGRHAAGAPRRSRYTRRIYEAVRAVAVLSDINMPGMDGLQLLAQIKQRFPDLPVMMLTAYGDEKRRRLAAEYGAAEFITKPTDFDQLKAQLLQPPVAAD
jgi:CheY-like chemotaxis protein